MKLMYHNYFATKKLFVYKNLLYKKCFEAKCTKVFINKFMFLFDCIQIIQEAPMIIESHYDERIVACCGGVGGKRIFIQEFYF